uniref:ADP-ribosylation factor-like 13A n=1 Tax=Salmo trutta TaxID=8032 RepID=A0A674D227_SALTR
MTNFCSWVSKIQQPIRKVNALVVSLDKAGKTSTLRVENFLVTLLDIGGALEVRGSWRDLYGEVHGFIFVVQELLTDLLKQLASKQDKMNALLGIEIIEILSLERLVKQSRCLCHIKSCSAFMDQLRWTDRKKLWGLCWLLHAVNLDYPELCSFIIRNIRDRRPLATDEGQPWEDGEAAASPNRKGKRETITLATVLQAIQKKRSAKTIPHKHTDKHTQLI